MGDTIRSITGRILGVGDRVTMYRLVLDCLAGLAVVAMVCSLTGLIAYTPAAVVLSWAVPLVTSFVSNRVIAAIYGVTPHSESSLITGYLLFFIFPPSTSVVGLLGLALAAVFASATKYLLAVRGRHIFNPAAAGAFALTACGIYYSGWWVGNPVMLVFTAFGAILIIRRTRRFPMAATFIITSGGIMIIRSLVVGLPVGTAALWPLTSSPMVFFAGFMLTEPLTQPPLRWQQLTMAVVTGALFSIPLHVGSIYIAPESALLIGNALAFAFGQRKGIELVLQRVTRLTPSTMEFAFSPTRKLTFRPGQYLELTLPHKGADGRGLRRVFSISSAPDDGGPITIGTKIPAEASSFKRTLGALSKGDTIAATTIAGDFILPKDAATPVLLVAGGIGITPFASQLAAADTERALNTVLVYSVAGADEISYRDVLEKSGATVVLVAPEAPRNLPDRWTHIVGTRVSEEVLAQCVADISSRHVYISGPPQMVAGVDAAARRLNAASVRTDYFSGY